MTEYRKAKPNELEEVLDFINMVFSMDHCPHDFRRMLPKLYGEHKVMDSWHYIALEDQKIMAAVCVLPLKLCQKNTSLTCGEVGSVSVHPYARGKGHMKALMALALEDMKKEGFSMSSLSGRRNRYQYYGYEKGGYYWDYLFLSDNFRHCTKHFSQQELVLLPLEDASSPFLPAVLELFRQQSFYCLRKEEFFLSIGKSWDSSLYVVLLHGEFQGYLIAAEDHISELRLKSPSLLFSCLQAFSRLRSDGKIHLKIHPWEQEQAFALRDLCEDFSLSLDDNYQIFDLLPVVSFFLDLKAATCSLADGSFDLSVEGQGSYRIRVENGRPLIVPLSQKTDFSLTSMEAVAFFFSPVSFSRERLPLEVKSWFPLPLCLPFADKC